MQFVKESVSVESHQRELLEQWSRAHGTPQQVAKRCRIILLNEQSWSDLRIAKELGLNRHTCRLWRQRFAKEGADALWEIAQGRGRKPQPGLSRRILETTLHAKPQGR
ncbi:MAG TPA: helix-turn-helix domain-containing protein [Verrucomicrobiae bacterium]